MRGRAAAAGLPNRIAGARRKRPAKRWPHPAGPGFFAKPSCFFPTNRELAVGIEGKEASAPALGKQSEHLIVVALPGSVETGDRVAALVQARALLGQRLRFLAC